MKNQEIFDRVSKHLLKQGERAMDLGVTGSVYHAVNGNQCAIGCLIPKARYTPLIENVAVEDLPERVPGFLETIIGNSVKRNMNLLCELQHIHDMTEPSEWANELQKTARRFGLKYKGAK